MPTRTPSPLTTGSRRMPCPSIFLSASFEGLRLAHCHEIRAHDVAHEQRFDVAGIRCYRAHDDVPVGENADRHAPILSILNDDEIANVRRSHLSRGLDNRLVPGCNGHAAFTDFPYRHRVFPFRRCEQLI